MKGTDQSKVAGWKILIVAGNVEAKVDEVGDLKGDDVEISPAAVEVTNLMPMTIADVADAINADKAKSVFVDAKVDIGVHTDSKLFSMNTDIAPTNKPINNIAGMDGMYQFVRNDLYNRYGAASTGGVLWSMSSQHFSQSKHEAKAAEHVTIESKYDEKQMQM